MRFGVPGAPAPPTSYRSRQALRRAGGRRRGMEAKPESVGRGRTEEAPVQETRLQNQQNLSGVEGGKNCAGTQEHDRSKDKVEPERFSKPNKIISPRSGSKASMRASPNDKVGGATRKRSWPSPTPEKAAWSPSPKRIFSWRGSPRKGLTSTSFNSSPRALAISPQITRRSWCRSSLKGTNCRKSLPPFHQDITELSKSISLDLPETDRLSMLLLSSFQFSAQKLEHFLKQTDGFSPEAFKANVNSVSEELMRCTERLKLDGTLKKCTEELKGILSDPALNVSLDQIKEYITRFTTESQTWDQLLLSFQKSAEEMSRQLEQCKMNEVQMEPASYLGASQAEVLNSKPNYQKILDSQGEVFDCMELVLDELQQAVKLLQAFTEDSTQYLRNLSEQLASRTFQQLENSPIRKLLKVPQKKAPVTQGQQPPEG